MQHLDASCHGEASAQSFSSLFHREKRIGRLRSRSHHCLPSSPSDPNTSALAGVSRAVGHSSLRCRGEEPSFGLRPVRHVLCRQACEPQRDCMESRGAAAWCVMANSVATSLLPHLLACFVLSSYAGLAIHPVWCTCIVLIHPSACNRAAWHRKDFFVQGACSKAFCPPLRPLSLWPGLFPHPLDPPTLPASSSCCFACRGSSCARVCSCRLSLPPSVLLTQQQCVVVSWSR